MSELAKSVKIILNALDKLLLDKKEVSRLALTCFLSKGHLLLEDVPGVGKTTLAIGLSRLLGLDFVRIQMTSDLLPGDLLGVSIFDPKIADFVFHKGPLFNSLVLVDEINRASPRTQSALLESMAEGQISVDGVTYPLADPFFVIATQNPAEETGVYPLPESQLDRFMMRLVVGYPSENAERSLIRGDFNPDSIKCDFCIEEITTLRANVATVFLSDEIVDMILNIVHLSRSHKMLSLGISPRGMMAIKTCSQSLALLSGREYVIPDDLNEIIIPVISHRIVPKDNIDRVTAAQTIVSEAWGF
jgi:MoxR-like ATPase